MLLSAMVGIYPQVRSMRTILTGLGWLNGSWEALHLVNERKIFSVEPVLESLIQVLQAPNLSSPFCYSVVLTFCCVHASLVYFNLYARRPLQKIRML